MKVWAVTVGAYSSAYVAAVFSDEDTAYEWAYDNDGHIDEFALDETAPRKLKRGERYWDVRMSPDGNGAQATVCEWKPPHGDDGLFYGEHHEELTATVMADSEEKAIKIVNDRRSGWLAAGRPTRPSRNAWWPHAEFPPFPSIVR